MIAISILAAFVMVYLGYLIRKNAEAVARRFLVDRKPSQFAIRWFRFVGILWMSVSAVFLVILGMGAIFSTKI